MMKHNTEEDGHGVVRKVDATGEIWEYSCKDNELTGLRRYIEGDGVWVYLVKDGRPIAEFYFDHNFKELTGKYTAREDPHGHFKNITPLHFKRDN